MAKRARPVKKTQSKKVKPVKRASTRKAKPAKRILKVVKAARKAAARKPLIHNKAKALSRKAKTIIRKKASLTRAVSKPKKMVSNQMPPRTPAKANLLITFDPNHVGTAQTEVVALLEKVGEKPVFIKCEVEGLFKLAVKDAKKTVSQLKQLCLTNSGLFNATYHYAPIDSWCRSDLESMKKAIKNLLPGIGPQDRWKMQLNKRHYQGEGTELIMQLTEVVSRSNVDLTEPEKIIQVEIIGKDAGISVLRPNEYLSVPKTKQQ